MFGGIQPADAWRVHSVTLTLYLCTFVNIQCRFTHLTMSWTLFLFTVGKMQTYKCRCKKKHSNHLKDYHIFSFFQCKAMLYNALWCCTQLIDESNVFESKQYGQSGSVAVWPAHFCTYYSVGSPAPNIFLCHQPWRPGRLPRTALICSLPNVL